MKVIVFVLVAILFISSVPPVMNTDSRTYAIIGDSWSTFKDYTDNPWYPATWPDCEDMAPGIM